MPQSASDTPSREPASYESALAELDRLVQALESGIFLDDEHEFRFDFPEIDLVYGGRNRPSAAPEF